MTLAAKQIFVKMERESLDGVALHRPPPGYALRWYRPGDERKWVEIQRQAERYVRASEDLFRKEFGGDAETLGRRQAFLLDARATAVATATAWFDDDYHGRRYGRLHWVAVVPDFQGRGLSKPLLSAVLRRMRKLGHDRAYLRTATARIPAINLYAAFGFVPAIRSRQDYERWQAVNDSLKRPFDLKRLRRPME